MLLLAVDAAAAVSYRLQGSSGMSGRVLADGPKVRIDVDGGSVILTNDAGKTLLMLDPETKTYTTTTVAALTSAAALNISNVTAKARELGDGGPIEGFPTKRWQLDLGFDVEAAGTSVHVAMRSESWRTDKVPEAAASIAMAQAGRTGIAAIDKVIDSMDAANMKGFPLKDVTTVSTKPASGGEGETTSFSVEAHDIRVNVPATAAQFAVPADYKKK